MSFSSLPGELVDHIADCLHDVHVPTVLSFCLVSHQALSSGRRPLYRRAFDCHQTEHLEDLRDPWPINIGLLTALENPEIGILVRVTSGIGRRFRFLRHWQKKHQGELSKVTSWYRRALQACPLLSQADIVFSTLDDFSHALNALDLLPLTPRNHLSHTSSSITSITLDYFPHLSELVDYQEVFNLLTRSSIKSLDKVYCSDISWLNGGNPTCLTRFPFPMNKLYIQSTHSSQLANCSLLIPRTPYTLPNFTFSGNGIATACDLSVLPTLLDPSLRKLMLCFSGHFLFNDPLSTYFFSTPGPRLPLQIFLSYPLITSLTLLGTHGPSLRLLETLATSAPLLFKLSLAGSRWISASNLLWTDPDEIFPEPLILAALLKFPRLKELHLGMLPTSDPLQHLDLKTKLETRGIKVDYRVCREG